MSTPGSPHWVELAKRAAEGLEVALLWDRSGNRVKVAVSDERICHHLDLAVTRADALSAFHQPFAHAATTLANGRPVAALASRHDAEGGRR